MTTDPTAAGPGGPASRPASGPAFGPAPGTASSPAPGRVAVLDTAAAARVALACLDLTSLNEDDTEADVVRLCERAQSRHGAVAAVCVWPRFAALARRELPLHIAVAAVANFPAGGREVAPAVADTEEIVASGAEEVDIVLPYAALQAGDDRAVVAVLAAVRRAADGRRLKVILETGVLGDAATITRASTLALDAGADFLKTSTGKTPVSATPAAVRTVLAAIAADPVRRARVGLKASGGIRSVADAAVYIALVAEALGPAALVPARFRIGASSLLGDIESVLGGVGTALPDDSGVAPGAAPGY